jgi:hypothetical protein
MKMGMARSRILLCVGLLLLCGSIGVGGRGVPIEDDVDDDIDMDELLEILRRTRGPPPKHTPPSSKPQACRPFLDSPSQVLALSTLKSFHRR